VLFAIASASGCVVRRRRIESVAKSGGPLLTAGVEQLTKSLAERYGIIETLSATVDLEPSLLSTEKGEIAEYKDVRGFILIRKPESIRVIAQLPVVRSTAFDMVSDGQTFRVHLPSKNLLLVGTNRQTKPSEKKLENLRPQHLLEALLIRPPNPATEEAVVENWTETAPPSYIVHIIREAGARSYLARKVWFDRRTLQVTRQQVYEPSGDLVTDAHYAGWQQVGATTLPRQIIIFRPKDEYQLNVHFLTTNLNVPLEPEKFQISAPAGVQVRRLDDGSVAPGRAGNRGG
jgi:outer membrane lipoprotein-sorting protein